MVRVSFAFIAIAAGLFYAVEARAEMPPTASAQAMKIHDDLLQCYQQQNSAAGLEAEYKWHLQQKPNSAIHHFNYGVFLQRAGKTVAAAAEYKKAAQYEPSNVEYVGTYGRMLLFQRQYQEAYLSLARAVQLPGGEKFKNDCETARQYLQNIQMQNQINQMNKQNPGHSSTGGKKSRSDDDDD